MSIEVKVSVEKGKSRLFSVANEELTLIDLRQIMEKKWEAVGSNFLFLMNGTELDRDLESTYKLSKFKKDDHIEVVISPQENSDDKKKGDKDSKSEAKGSKEEPEETSANQKSPKPQLNPNEKQNWEKAPENDLIKDKESYESKDKAYYDNLNQAEKDQLLKRLKLPKALKLTLSEGLKYVDKPGYKLSQAITEKSFEQVDPQSVDKNETCFTALEKKAYEMLSENVSVSLKLPIPQLSAVFGLDANHETTSETQTQSKNTDLFMVAKRILPKVRVLIGEETIQLTDEFKNSVAQANDIGQLSEVFKEYGYFVPTAYTIGGSMIVVRTENVSANDQETASSKSFGLKVSGDLEKAGVTAGGSVGYNREKTNQSSETSVFSDSSYRKNVKGGDQSLVNDPAKWVSSLTFDKWAIVEYEDLKPITDFLPQDLKEKCKKLLTPAPAPLNKLPKEVAEEMSEMAKSVAWYAVNTRKKMDVRAREEFSGLLGVKIPGTDQIFESMAEKCEHDARNNEHAFNQHFEEMSKKVAALQLRLSPTTLKNIKQGALSVAQYTAKHRVAADDSSRYQADNMNLQKFNEYFESVKNSNEVTPQLAEHIQEMCMSIAWYAGNKHAGYESDESKNWTNFQIHYNKIWE